MQGCWQVLNSMKTIQMHTQKYCLYILWLRFSNAQTFQLYLQKLDSRKSQKQSVCACGAFRLYQFAFNILFEVIYLNM